MKTHEEQLKQALADYQASGCSREDVLEHLAYCQEQIKKYAALMKQGLLELEAQERFAQAGDEGGLV